ncbi:expressed unknown protein [Seminavis robusta]|uniref:Uncharacterized protein n=1 Tax=Seminavis robusta TaxID=568900 RepID=A0A9N8DXG6_9STRA|nr:expressed unknown protein [Seminavis robusta]|eukprot:Sro450_g145530.1 n/a (422) ;mRNA; f:24719-26179
MRSFCKAVAFLAFSSAFSSAFMLTPRHANNLISTRVSKPIPSSRLTSTSSPGGDGSGSPSKLERLAASFSQSAAVNISKRYKDAGPVSDQTGLFNVITLIRVGIPSVLGGIFATLVFPAMSLFLASIMNDAGVFTVLSQDSSQFVQNFLTVSGLLFSILVGQTYYFMYQQQEMVYYALFNEVTEAKSLLEQVALVCQGRSMYRRVLESISQYVRYDLKALTSDPAVLLSSRPVDDPLESIMYLTSVGVPSSVYETVRSLRQARASRLGALQRKLPGAHMVLLWILAAIELVSFPLLGAGTQVIGGYKILTVEGCLFGVMTAGIILTLRVVGELWRPAGGAYNVDDVLSVMVSGLEEELKARINGNQVYSSNNLSPSAPKDQGDDTRAAISEGTSTSMNAAKPTRRSLKQVGKWMLKTRRRT